MPIERAAELAAAPVAEINNPVMLLGNGEEQLLLTDGDDGRLLEGK